MWHVFGARGIRAAALVAATTALAVTAAFVTTGSANGAAATSNSASASCSNDMVTGAGSCSFSGNGSAGFGGEFDTPAVVIDQSQCPAQAIDGTDTICGHFSINTNNVQGNVTVTINFNPDNDLDLCVVNGTPPAAANAAPCSTGSGATETVPFTVGCADTHFEAQILPISYPFLGPTPETPAAYTGSVSASLTPCPIGGGGGGGTVPPTPCHKLHGGGDAAVAITPDGHFSVHIDDDRCINQKLKGKVRYSSANCDFRSTSITEVTWDDTTKTATITGVGNLRMPNDDPTVSFTATAHDGGPKNSGMDTFTIDQCDGGGTVVRGDVKYTPDTH